MADLNFPSSPSDGDVYLNYTFSSSSNTWNLNLDAELNNVGDVNVASASAGNSLVYQNQYWVPTSDIVVPTGAIFPYTSIMPPPGYLACSGQILSQSEYSKLYSVVGSTYNIGGEPSGTFRIPNLTARVPVGLNAAESEFTPLGKVGGNDIHTLSVDEMATHTHIQDAHTHSQNAHNHTQSSHSHSATASFGAPGGSFGYGFYGAFRNRVGVTGGWGLGTSSAQPAINANTATNQNTRAVNLSTGGGKSHNNLQPYITLTYIIKV